MKHRYFKWLLSFTLLFGVSSGIVNGEGTNSDQTQSAANITLDKTELMLKVGDPDISLTVTVTSANVNDDKTITWSSSNSSVATVNANGTVHAVASGKATITAKLTNGKTAKAIVTVPFPVMGVQLNQTELTLNIGTTAKLVPTVTPANATIKNVIWSSSNEAIATVSTEGVITPVSVGTAVITVTTAAGSKTATAVIHVVQPVTGITMNKTAVILKAGEPDITLIATIAPANATVKNVTWSTSNSKIATVNENGVVHAVASGKATITAKSANGKIAKTFVTVPFRVAGVQLNKTDLTIQMGSDVKLIPTIAPTKATIKNITWTSSNEAIAKVSDKGVITPVAPGTVTITVTTEDGAKTDSASIHIVQPVTGITLNKSTLSMKIGGPNVIVTATIAPTNATAKNVTWSTSNSKVATVDANGTVHAVASGKATITAKSTSGKSAKVIVTVTK
ncbi:Ig-like domain-containing protein [Paenibacillus sediminis]|uniref:Uncharacterized protein YjdB n=1 Tax=Paenibacillus sediminis TaxID=664909 RepID=A0ABS4H607_9BACL|nr:Ig-like domain-containing protein [Paenibacillus sediminis]MBP1937970.1 uncharacterized protein YjdB [Paenibacillus sediminis]